MRVSSVLASYYVRVKGQSGWINANCASAASNIAVTILANIPTNGAAPRYPST